MSLHNQRQAMIKNLLKSESEFWYTAAQRGFRFRLPDAVFDVLEEREPAMRGKERQPIKLELKHPM